ncbi:response regulator transcription factor [Clostridium estertheticum]|uniref:response regulator transcription factor n=1 Tax=Clostridium estertheticum TaxID=238834 RepID=UPI0028150CA1|nr:response regulator transcription factor [Clostridium estertheticum]
MQEKILIVDDNYEIILFIKPALEAEGFFVEYATSGISAMEKIKDDLSLILLDVMLPEFNGFDICRRKRESIPCPIIFLTARGLEEERIKGFLVGGDDYIVKPFSLKELVLRIKAHIRRYNNGITEKKKIHWSLQI